MVVALGDRVAALSPEAPSTIAERAGRERRELVPASHFANAGETFVLTANEAQSAVWLCHRNPKAGSVLFNGQFTREAARAWKDACAAVPRSGALVLNRGPLAVPPPSAARLGGRSARGAPLLNLDIDGASCGLAFAISVASATIGVPLPTTIAASGEVDAHGAVRPVHGLLGKVRALSEFAPGVEHLLVADGEDSEHATEWRNAARIVLSERYPRWGGVEIIPVKSVKDAIGFSLEANRVQERLEAVIANAQTHLPILRQLLEIAMTTGQTGLLTWEPVAAALRQLYPGLVANMATDEAERLRLLWMISHRWARSTLPPEEWILPSTGWIRSRPPAQRAAFAAQVVQNATDSRVPSREDALALAQSCAHSSTPGLKLRGALARLSLRGDCSDANVARALTDQREVAEGFGDQFLAPQATYGLAEWVRLTGVMRDRHSFELARTFAEDIELRGGFEEGGRTFVDVCLARAAIMLAGEPANAGERSALTTFAEEKLRSTLAATVNHGDQRWPPVCLRWRARAYRNIGDEPALLAVLAELRNLKSSNPTASVSRALTELDIINFAGTPPEKLVGWLESRGDAALRELAEQCDSMVQAGKFTVAHAARRCADLAAG